jgi:hypothetical protein
MQKVEPKNQGCQKSAKNARFPAKEKQVTAIEQSWAEVRLTGFRINPGDITFVFLLRLHLSFF